MNRSPLELLGAVPRPSRRAVRTALVALLLAGTLALANGAVGGRPGPAPTGDGTVPYGTVIDLEEKINTSDPTTHPIPPDAEVTVVATQGFFPDDENADLVAVTRNGTLVYHNNTYGVYFDVDPVRGTRYTFEYVASAQLAGEACEEFASYRCTRNVIERVNISTGEVDRLYAEKTPSITATRWHDADRINDTHVAIADIYRDSLRVVNLSSDGTVWEWNATNIYDHEGDRPPQDWTHLNDVEILDNGTFMLSMRNMDEVVFVNRSRGYLPGMTLGENGNRDVLFEQHNPDYIPAENGGPAILVGDSENNRVIEYQRVNGEWQRSWIWKDPRMQWPRDADRLPNGRTLMVDSNGDRVLEVSPNGSIAWQLEIGMPYDVERLGTGDESTGGPAMRGGGAVVSSGAVDRLLLFVKGLLPSKLVNGALFSASAIGAGWMTFSDLLVVAVMLLALLTWALLEYRWAAWSVTGAARGAVRRARARL